MHRFGLATVAVLFAWTLARAQAPLDGFDEWVQKSMKDHGVPGLAVAIVKDGQVVFSKGYGVRKLGQPEPVTDQTLFAIASVSKAMTAAALGTLVDEGKLNWDDPVIKHLPAFQMNDPAVTREITIRDLLTHRSGLLRHDGIWFGSPDTREMLIWKLRQVKLDHGFRSKYSYQNLMYLVAGQAIPAISGQTWDDALQTRFFKPLGMKSTITSIRQLPKDGDVATPFGLANDKLIDLPWRMNDHMAPAGAVISNVKDMAQWLRFQLGDGTWDAKRILTKGTLQETHTPQVVVRLEGLRAKMYPDVSFLNYGLGWFVSDYQGKKAIDHGGSLDGFISQVGLLPSEKLGVVVLCNHGETQLPRAIMNTVFDRYLGVKKRRDWSQEMKAVAQLAIDQVKDVEKKDEEARVKETKPTFPLVRYAGTYQDGLHTPLVLSLEKDQLVAKFLGMTFDVQHWHYDTFRFADRQGRFAKFLMTFSTNPSGKIASAQCNIFGEDYEMARTADALPPELKLNAEQRAKFVGQFSCKLPEVDVTIEEVQGVLMFTFPGLAPLALRATQEREFHLPTTPEASVLRFEFENEKVKKMLLIQGAKNYIFEPKKKPG